ncbi:transcriptional regulator, RpiR family [Ketogulonicigenium robustum]|uniref:Transcriptional regulator, RpiR family n=1 Tax=Ketogulonicigenium robustum TaxID=92947 RepID=A0A1W6NW09_9RHOB|nr:MurR/RpiR family transcriptional regulator [Ketogulonicigenium robustum]ARO13401.1 transcriptional regulator, RpiR family [Ketogulonicigenium robustum]
MSAGQVWAQNNLPAGSVVGARIAEAYPEFSQALRSFADFVLAEPMKVAQMTINETVHASGVSVATANRFARKLGYDGYPAFRSDLIGGFEAVLAPADRLRRTIQQKTGASAIYASVLEDDIDNLTEARRNLNTTQIEDATAMISDAGRLFVLAFEQGLPLAQIFAHNLTVLGRQASTAAAGGKLAALAELGSYGPQDLVVTFGFRRYIRETVDLAHALHRRGVPLLVITDAPSSPLAALGAQTLYIQAKREVGATSDAAVLSVLEALAACVAACRTDAADNSARFAELAQPWLIAR